MEFSKEELEEFKNEALEMLDEAERHLLSLEKGGEFAKSYDAVFRVFHSLKGGAGMLGMQSMQAHMHHLESHYQQCKPLKSLSKDMISYFLKGVDASRQLMNGDQISFEYNLPSTSENPASPPSPIANQLPPIESMGTSSLELKKVLEKNDVDHFSIKVMIIDDEIDIANTLREILNKVGFEAICFTSAEEALSKVKEEAPEVVITDIRMDNLSGFEVLKRVFELDPELPVILVSGFITKELIIEALSFGVFAAIEKPFTATRVIEACKNAGQKYRLSKLLNKLIHFIYYQYSDLEQHWKNKGGDLMRETMHSELKELIEANRKLKTLKKRPVSGG